jgi:hypothetical protein
MVLNYEDPGEGGIYEDFGWPKSSSNLVEGDELWGFMPFRGPARRSHYGVAYSWGRRGQGVTLSYEGLDPGAEYVLRISVGVHAERQDLPVKDLRLEQGLEINGRTISEAFEVPMGDVRHVEFPVPQDLTSEGRIVVKLVPKSELFPVTGLNELWLMRRDKMPWSAPRS